MNITRSLLSLSSVAVALLVGGCADGNAPKIKRFEASNTALPEGGAEVTFTWEVKNEKSLTLEPYPGAVTGTSATVVVTDATVFTLTAKNGDKKDRKRISFTVGEAFAVIGQAVDFRRRPVAAAHVFVDDQFFVTDEDGFFTASNVIPPYDLGWVETDDGGGFPALGVPGGAGEIDVVLYRDVTRADPVMLVNALRENFDGYASISGALSGGDGFPFPTPTPDPNYGISVSGTTADGEVSFSSSPASSPDYTAELYWVNSALEQQFTIGVLQYKREPSVVFTGLGRHQGVASHLDALDVDLALTPVGQGTIAATVSAPFDVLAADLEASLDLGLVDGTMLFGGLPQIFSESYSLPSQGLTSAGTLTLAVPVVPDGTYTARSYAYGDDVFSSRVDFGLQQGASIDAEMPAVPVLLTPVDGATVGPNTVFSVANVDDAIYAFFFQSGGSVTFGAPVPTLYLAVYTNSALTSFPDHIDLGGVQLEGRQFDWGASAAVGYGNLDGLLLDAGVPQGGSFAFSQAFDVRYFYYGEPSGPF